jgi:hypothetical protein
MSLPRIEYPVYSFKIPSTGKMQNFRPFLVKEDKLLLMAKESGEDIDILRALRQIVNNCCIDDKFNIDNITLTDLHYLFIRLRAMSVGNKLTKIYIDTEDEKEYPLEINLNEIKVVSDKELTNRVMITKNTGMLLCHPPVSTINEDNTEQFYIVAKCIDKIFEGDEIYEPKNYTTEELIEFVENLNVNSYTEVVEFIKNSPHIEYKIEYKNSLDHDRKVFLKTLNDFFTYR